MWATEVMTHRQHPWKANKQHFVWWRCVSHLVLLGGFDFVLSRITHKWGICCWNFVVHDGKKFKFFGPQMDFTAQIGDISECTNITWRVYTCLWNVVFQLCIGLVSLICSFSKKASMWGQRKETNLGFQACVEIDLWLWFWSGLCFLGHKFSSCRNLGTFWCILKRTKRIRIDPLQVHSGHKYLNCCVIWSLCVLVSSEITANSREP